MKSAQFGRRAIFREQTLARRQRERLWRSGLWLLLALLVLVDLVIFAHHSNLLISRVRISGTETVDQSLLYAATQQILAGNYWRILPRRHALWYPRKTLERELLTQFPALASVRVMRENFTAISVQVVERRGQYLWCNAASVGTCFLLDRSGLAFAPAPIFSGRSFIKFSTPALAPALNARPLSPPAFTQALALLSGLDQALAQTVLAGFTVDELTVVNDGFYRLHATRETNKLATQSLAIFIGIKQAVDELNLTLRSALATPDFIAEWRDAALAGLALEYLDLRSPGKVFYKFIIAE